MAADVLPIKAILEEELEQNFRVSIDDISAKPDNKKNYEIHVFPPPVKVKLKRVHKRYEVIERPIPNGFSLEIEKADRDRYRLIHTVQQGVDLSDATRSRLTAEDLTAGRRRQEFAPITLVAEVARYLNKSPLTVESLLYQTKESVSGILAAINEFNELLYNWIIPRLFVALYDVQEFERKEEYEVELVKEPPKGFYEVRADPKLVSERTEALTKDTNMAGKSFHLDRYCFDSAPEKTAFWKLLHEKRVQHIYFTGMLTHGQSDFFVQYIDPDSHTIRTYYPDFLIQETDGSYTILEVKADNQIEEPVVQAKKFFAQQMASASGMRYAILPSTAAQAERISSVFAQ